jgi:hypothetical protein
MRASKWSGGRPGRQPLGVEPSGVLNAIGANASNLSCHPSACSTDTLVCVPRATNLLRSAQSREVARRESSTTTLQRAQYSERQSPNCTSLEIQAESPRFTFEVGNPCGAVAQLGERLNRTQEVVSSILISSTNKIKHLRGVRRRVFVFIPRASRDRQKFGADRLFSCSRTERAIHIKALTRNFSKRSAVVVNFSQVENMVADGVVALRHGRVSEVPEQLAARKLSFSDLTKELTRLYRYRFPSEDETRLTALREKLFQINEQRNELVHSFWGTGDTQATLTRYRQRKVAQFIRLQVSAAEVLQFAITIEIVLFQTLEFVLDRIILRVADRLEAPPAGGGLTE